MMKYLTLLGAAAVIAGCTTLDQKEARCKCFKSDGTATGNCDFTRLPADPAQFSFVATRASADLMSFAPAAATSNGETCRAGA